VRDKPSPPASLIGASLLLALSGASAQEAKTTDALPTLTVNDKKTITTATRLEADPLRIPFTTYSVDRAQIDAVGAVTLEDTLRTVPGLQFGTQGNYYTRFETRGLRDTQDVLVLIDGVPLRQLQGNADITLIAPDLVDRVEFIKGPASALYGKNAIGGVAQFFMKPERAGGTVTTTLGSFGRTDASVRYRWDFERGNLYIGAANNDYKGFQRDAGRAQAAAVLGGDFAVTGNWSTGFQIYDSHVRGDRGSIVPLQNGKPMFGIGSRDNYGIADSYVVGDYESLAWKNKIDFGGGWSLNHLSSFSRYDRFFAGGITIVPPPAAVNKGYSESDTSDRGVFHDVALTWLTGGKSWSNELQFGVNIERGWQNLDSPTFTNAPTYRGPFYNVPVSNVRNDPRGIRGATTYSRFDQEVRSFYVQDRFEWGAFGVTAGLRHDKFEQTLGRSGTSVISAQEGSRTSPRLGADWAFARNAAATHAVFANWSEGFRPQAVALNTRNNMVVPDILRPELTRSKEVGVKGRAANDAWAYQLSLFEAEKVDGQRAYRSGPDSFVFSNATSRTKGIESSMQFQLSQNWNGYVHYTWQDARLKDFQTYTDSGARSTNFGGYRVRMSAHNIAGAGLTWAQGPWSVTGTANYVGSRYLRDNTVNPQKLPGYLLANVAVSYKATPQLTLQAGVNNLANKYYIGDDLSAQDAGNAGAPRTFFARARYTF
jgi:outer membrane receptor protein involved in Fe transport